MDVERAEGIDWDALDGEELRRAALDNMDDFLAQFREREGRPRDAAPPPPPPSPPPSASASASPPDPEGAAAPPPVPTAARRRAKRASSPPRWRFVKEAKSTMGYSSVAAGTVVEGTEASELGAQYVAPAIAREERPRERPEAGELPVGGLDFARFEKEENGAGGLGDADLRFSRFRKDPRVVGRLDIREGGTDEELFEGGITFSRDPNATLDAEKPSRVWANHQPRGRGSNHTKGYDIDRYTDLIETEDGGRTEFQEVGRLLLHPTNDVKGAFEGGVSECVVDEALGVEDTPRVHPSTLLPEAGASPEPAEDGGGEGRLLSSRHSVFEDDKNGDAEDENGNGEDYRPGQVTVVHGASKAGISEHQTAQGSSNRQSRKFRLAFLLLPLLLAGAIAGVILGGGEEEGTSPEEGTRVFGVALLPDENTTQPSFSLQPSFFPSFKPSRVPTHTPTSDPTGAPSEEPSALPTRPPSVQPSRSPTDAPSGMPSAPPSRPPSVGPSLSPTNFPSARPSQSPTAPPTHFPSVGASQSPSDLPSSEPTMSPTSPPSVAPSPVPTNSPSSKPTTWPTNQPSMEPSRPPTDSPSSAPSLSPTSPSSTQPSGSPSSFPSKMPSNPPSSKPTQSPTTSPTYYPIMYLGACARRFVPKTYYPIGTLVASEGLVYKCIDYSCSTWGFEPGAGWRWREGWEVTGSCDRTLAPTGSPTTLEPSATPSTRPTRSPSGWPTDGPTLEPSAGPSTRPTGYPSYQPTGEPTLKPSAPPSPRPTRPPSAKPTHRPTRPSPTKTPTRIPTVQPTCEENGDFNLCYAIDMSGSVCNGPTGSLCESCRPLNVCNSGGEKASLCCPNFSNVLEFTKDLTTALGRLSTEQDFSVVQFGTDASIVSTLVSSSQAVEFIDGLKYSGGKTNLAGAIASCQQTLRQSPPGRNNLMLVITDGAPTIPEGTENARNAASIGALTAKRQDTFIIPVLIEEQNPLESTSIFLRSKISSDEKVFVSDFQGLNDLLESLFEQVTCPGNVNGKIFG